MDPRMMLAEGPDTPSLFGVSPDGGRTIVPELLLGRHYNRVPGGILAALAAASEYEGNPGWGSQLDPAGYSDSYPVSVGETGGGPGFYSMGGNAIQISDFLREIRPTLEHEATHAALVSRLSPEDARAVSVSASTDILPGEHIEYLTSPAEMDVRLAEAKRLYAREKGILVDTPEKAAEAWEYYKGRYMSQPAMDAPTMGDDYQTYEKDPLLLKEMMQRMPGVVSAEDLIRSLIYG